MGYKTVTPIILANLLHAQQEGMINAAGVRCIFGLLEMQAIREAATRTLRKQGRRGATYYRFKAEELAELTGLTERKTRTAVKTLEQAGIVTVDIRKLTFTATEISGSENLVEEFRCKRSARRPIPIPRKVLTFLAKNTSIGLTKAMLAYLLRGMSIDRRTGEIRSRGTVKASWIAEHLDQSIRTVKYAQAQLRGIGWIGKDEKSYQRKLNRTGAYFEIDLNWPNAAESSEPKPTELGGAREPASQSLVPELTRPNRIAERALRTKTEATPAPSTKTPPMAREYSLPTITPLLTEEPRDLPPIPTRSIAQNLLSQLQAARRAHAMYKSNDESSGATVQVATVPTRHSAPTANHFPRSAPLPPKICTPFAPPYKDLKTHSEDKNQKTPKPESRSGFCEKREERDATPSRTATSPTRPLLLTPRHFHLPPPTWTNLRIEDLKHPGRLDQLFDTGAARGILRPTEQERLNLHAAAVRARTRGRDPVRLFVALVHAKLWHHITNAEEDQAMRQMKQGQTKEARMWCPASGCGGD